MGDAAAVNAGFDAQAASAMPDKRSKAAAARYWRSSYSCERPGATGGVDSGCCAGAGPINLETCLALGDGCPSSSQPVGNLVNVRFAQAEHSTPASCLHQPSTRLHSRESKLIARSVA